MHVITQLECLANGANGIWAGLCEEGAMLGHACSTLMMMNLVRMGNKRILKKYNKYTAKPKITTGVNPPLKQPVYGARALDVVFGMDQFTPDKKDFSMVDFFGRNP
eukprot:gene11797-13018_t